jgi:polysaccharide biosynthesis protein PelE
VSASRSALAVAVYSVLDGALAFRLLTDVPDTWSLAASLIGHLLLSLLAGLALLGATPAFIRATRREIVGCGALVAACVPVLGPLGMLLVFRFGLTAPREQSREPWVVFDLKKDVEEHQRHPLRTRRAAVSALEIRTALKHRTEETAAHRFQSVLAIQKLPPRAGVPLLKIAQSDPSDEIRLYAFSRLERMRDNLEKQVKEVTTSLATVKGGAEAARLHLRLAQSYWELGYLGLAEGAVLAHALKSAHLHAAIASEESPMHAPAEFFLGRILLQLREPERATTAFERAIRAGYPRIKVLPWLAECAFYERDFGTVRLLLGELESLSPENVFFQPVSDFWADRQADRGPPPRGSRESLRIGSERKMTRGGLT